MEEAEKADKIGFMRNGRILVEGAPDHLKAKFEQSTLDSVFLYLCEQDEVAEEAESKLINGHSSKQLKEGSSNDEKKCFAASSENVSNKAYDTLAALVFKDYCVKKRNKFITLFASFFPLFIFLTFLGSIGQPIRDLRVAVVNEESNCIRGKRPDLVCPELSTLLEDGFSIGSNLSCHIVYKLDPFVFGTVSEMSLDEAVSSVTLGDDVAYIRVESGFSEALNSRVKAMATLDPGAISQREIEISQLKVNMDATNLQIVQTVRLHILLAIRNFLVEFADACDMGAVSDSLFSLGLDFTNVAEGQSRTNWNLSHTMMPGVISMVLMLLALALTADQLVSEKEEGLLTRDYVCGVTIPVYLSAQMFVHCSVIAVQILLSGIFLKALFLSLPWPIVLFFVPFWFTQSVCGMSVGLAITVIGKNKDQVIQMGMAIIFPLVLLSGILWPLIAMPNALRILALAMPTTVPAEVSRAIVLNQTLAVPNLAAAFLVPLAWTAVNFVICLVAIRMWGFKI